MNNIITPNLDEQMTKIKVVELQKLYNFIIEHLFNFNLFWPTKSTFQYLKFEIWIFQTTLDGETTKMKIVDKKSYETL